jgi:hypothetical protein
MSSELPDATVRREGTWRWGSEAPERPTAGDVTTLLSPADRHVVDDTVVVRLRIDSTDQSVTHRVRDWLRDEDPVVAASTAPGAVSGDAGAVDVLVESGYDAAPVGSALYDVEAVDAVAAAAFETAAAGRAEPPATRPDGGTGGERSQGATADGRGREAGDDREGPPGDVDQAVIDEMFDALQEEVDPVPYDSLVDELDRQPLAGTEVDLDPLLSGDGASAGAAEPRGEDACRDHASTDGEPAGAPDERPAGSERSTSADGARTHDAGGEPVGRPAAPEGHPAAALAERLDATERRLAVLEDRLDAGGEGAGFPGAAGQGHRDAARRPGRAAGEPNRADGDRRVPERLAELEATVEALVEEHAKLRAALCGESG